MKVLVWGVSGALLVGALLVLAGMSAPTAEAQVTEDDISNAPLPQELQGGGIDGLVQSGFRPCASIVSATAMPQGFGSPLNVFAPGARPMIDVLCRPSDHKITINVDLGGNQILYRKGYLWKNGWREIEFTPIGDGERAGEHWITNAARRLSVFRANSDYGRGSYVLAYVCSWRGDDGGWKCGCRDAACATPHWQVQAFPTSALGLGAGATTGAGSGGGSTDSSSSGASDGSSGSTGGDVRYAYHPSDLNTKVGQMVGGGEPGIVGRRGTHSSDDHLVYGPYATNWGTGRLSAHFRMKNIISPALAAGTPIALLEVYDATTDKVIERRLIRKCDVPKNDTYYNYTVNFTLSQDRVQHKMETRVRWYGNDTTKLRWVIVKSGHGSDTGPGDCTGVSTTSSFGGSGASDGSQGDTGTGGDGSTGGSSSGSSGGGSSGGSGDTVGI